MRKNKNSLTKNKYLIGVVTGFLLAILTIKLIPTLVTQVRSAKISLPFAKLTPTPTPNLAANPEELIKVIIPEKLDLGISFGEAIVKMVQVGAIDKNKFTQLYQERGGFGDLGEKILEQPAKEKVVVTQANSNLILNLLWPLGIANKTKVLAEGPMGTQYKDQVGNFASTGGWTLGKQEGGKLFNRFAIVSLTPEQEAEVKEIAEGIYRPCCGNSTYFPDCNHGAAMLGFLELAVAQGLSKEEIYKKALVLNAYWFPQTYAEAAVYFQAKKGLTWDKVDPKEVLGANYSSGQGARAVNKELQAAGLIPEVKGGGGCGV